MLKEHKERPVPAGDLGPAVPGGLGDRGRGAGFGDYGQVAGLSYTQVSYTLPGDDAQRVAPERVVGGQLAERRQAVRRRAMRGDIRPGVSALGGPSVRYGSVVSALLIVGSMRGGLLPRMRAKPRSREAGIPRSHWEEWKISDNTRSANRRASMTSPSLWRRCERFPWTTLLRAL